MKPRIKLASATTPDGTELDLYEHDGHHEISIRGAGLMGTRQHHSEEELARYACEDLPDRPVVMVGGLGMGFTLRAALDLLPENGKVLQVELVPEIVKWNRTTLGAHAGEPLEDPRTKLVMGDVVKSIARERGTLAAIMLDIDNGSEPMVMKRNARLYSRKGLEMILRALIPGGRVAVWSATDDPLFANKLKRAGLHVTQHEAHARPGRKGARHCIIVGRKHGG